MSTILKVSGKNTCFGCVHAQDLCGNRAMIIVYEDLKNWYLNEVPAYGSMFLCSHYHSSVYIPFAYIIHEHLLLRKLYIPNDVLYEYFPITRRSFVALKQKL